MRKSLPYLFAAVIFAVCVGSRAVAVEAPKATFKVGGDFDVEEQKDIAYHDGPDADKVKHKLDLFLPKKHKDYPVMIYIHGGSWQSGDKKELLDPYGKIARTFARNGIGVAVANYRLSPKVQHPGHVQDVAKAFAWVHGNIARHGGRADCIFLCGHSAGGHLVALLATDESYLKAEKKSLADIRGVIGMSGVYWIPPKLLSAVFGEDEKALQDAGPIHHVNGKHPPFLLLYANKDLDTLDMMAVKFAAALTNCKCEATAVEIKGRDHFTIMLRMPKVEDPTTQAMFEFIARHSDLKLTEKEAESSKE